MQRREQISGMRVYKRIKQKVGKIIRKYKEVIKDKKETGKSNVRHGKCTRLQM
jgi:hypothetical protein